MAAQERDNSAPTDPASGQPEPAAEVGSDEAARADDPARSRPEPPGSGEPPGPGGSGPGDGSGPEESSEPDDSVEAREPIEAREAGEARESGEADQPSGADGPSGPEGRDDTAVLSGTEGPGAPPPVGPSGTAVMPPVAGDASGPQRPRWSARAQVPTPRIEDYTEEWVPEPPRRSLVPVLVTIFVTLLAGVFGFGIWLALVNDSGPAPSPSAPPATTPATTTTSTTPAPTTTTPSPTPSGIEIPNLVGQLYEDAALTLAGLGFETQRVDLFNATVPEGRVIVTDPTPGSVVPTGETITIIVSKGPEPTQSPAGSGEPTGGDDEEDEGDD